MEKDHFLVGLVPRVHPAALPMFSFVLPSILKETVALVQFDASDMVVLLSNLLDNAIEACQQYEKEDKTIHVTAIAQQAFFISIRNTSKPVVILNDSIPTTKPEPQLHGFGLVNIHLILENIMENIPCSMRMDGFNSLLTYLSLRFRDKKVHFVILL